jgi:hypothetical protein
MNQALIKKTGEIFDITSEYSMIAIKISLPIVLDISKKDSIESSGV